MNEEVLTFGPFRLRPAQRTLSKDGKPVRIGGRALDILAALTERAGQTVSKEELIARAWPDMVVEEAALRVHSGGAAQSARRWAWRQALHSQPCRARLRLCRTGDAQVSVRSSRPAKRRIGRQRPAGPRSHASSAA